MILTFQPDTAAGVARVLSEPPLAGLAVDATVPLSRAACGDWRAALRARFEDANMIRFEGQYPGRCGEKVWPVAYQDPASYAARAMEGLWRASGGALTGQARTGLTPPGVTLLHEAQSLPLSEIIADVNHWSNNVMAQQVFLTLGRLAPARRELRGVTRAQFQPMRTGRFERSREAVSPVVAHHLRHPQHRAGDGQRLGPLPHRTHHTPGAGRPCCSTPHGTRKASGLCNRCRWPA